MTPKEKDKINWTLMLCCILTGIVLGMVTMHFIYVYSIERVLSSATGIIGSIEISINETKAVDRMMNWTFNYWDNKKFITTNYSQELI